MKTKLLSALVVGETLLMSVKRVKNDTFQAEFGEIVANPKRNTALSGLNIGDARFEQGKPGVRRAYAKVTPEAMKKYFGIDITVLKKEGEIMADLNILNPEMEGSRLRVEVKESHLASEWAQANLAKAAKQYESKALGTRYFVKDGKLIFSNTRVTNVEPSNTIIGSDTQLSWEEVQALATPYEVPAKVGEKTKALNK